jgi:HPt (histidine-containing phosphotransfer) domain-containing protein
LLDAPRRIESIELHLDVFDRARLASERVAAIAAAAYETHSLSGASATLRLEPLATQLERLELALRDRRAESDGSSSTPRARELLATIAALVADLSLQAGGVKPRAASA